MQVSHETQLDDRLALRNPRAALRVEAGEAKLLERDRTCSVDQAFRRYVNCVGCSEARYVDCVGCSEAVYPLKFPRQCTL